MNGNSLYSNQFLIAICRNYSLCNKLKIVFLVRDNKTTYSILLKRRNNKKAKEGK